MGKRAKKTEPFMDGADLQGPKLVSLTNRERLIFGALFGVSNLGFRDKWPKPQTVARWIQARELSIERPVLDMVQDLLENDEMLEMFVEESKSWQEEQLKHVTLAKLKGANWSKDAALLYVQAKAGIESAPAS